MPNAGNVFEELFGDSATEGRETEILRYVDMGLPLEASKQHRIFAASLQLSLEITWS